MDLSDLTSIKPAVEGFTTQESRIDVLINNAGVMFPPDGSRDAQGNDLQMGTNCLGPYLLIRVLWAGSIAVHVGTPNRQGIIIDANGQPEDKGVKANYGQTKVGNVFIARELAKTTAETGVVHAAFNPGNLRTELQRHWTGLDHWIVDKTILYPPIFGAYTELWTSLAPELAPDRSGAYAYPWGRLGALPDGIEESLTHSGISERFLQWCESQTREFI
ncbi:hypothetical protein F5B22DRAFT_662253 [Xylaria bambusicola]|uniref:uncharacterized protein n=1 Tax=Xylaria bambusicola TaxID=326684 RepID=UPI002007A94F|nr:uncharacterized protein F5B22DRAFT_662253 [Xylaria bambusicola]KAI0503166.1 hypothetical protein F5B22DRAFT_662253 [Xylaria bambusicola]